MARTTWPWRTAVETFGHTGAAWLRAGLARNALWLALARFAAGGLSLAFTALLARRLGQAGLGQYAFLAAVVFVGNVLTTFGTDTLVIRETARDEAHSLETAAGSLWLQLLLSVGFLALVATLSPWLTPGDTSLRTALLIYSLALFPLAPYTVFSAILRGLQRMGSFLVLTVATNALLVLAGLLAARPSIGLGQFAAALVVAQAAAALLAAYLCRNALQAGRALWLPSRAAALRALRQALPLALLGIVGVLYQRLAVLLLPYLAGAVATGTFSAASRLLEAMKVFHIAVLGGMFPIASSLVALDPDGRRPLPAQPETGLLRSTLVGLLAFALIAAAAVSAFAAPLVHAVFGARYDASTPALRILVWTLVPYSISAVLSLGLVARRREGLVLTAALAALLTALLLDLVLIPRAAAIGASAATLLAECIQALVLAAMAWREAHVRTRPSRDPAADHG